MMNYNPRNWYWAVGGSTTQVYSSAGTAYVPIADATYEAWLAAGGMPTIIDTEANLAGVFDAQYPQGWYKNSAMLAGQDALAAGIAIGSTSMPSLNGTYALSSSTLLYITGAISYCLLKGQFPGGASTLTFYDATNTPHVFSTIAEFEAFGEAVATYVNQVQDYINSGGTSGSLPSNNVTIV